MNAVLILGNQLFDPSILNEKFAKQGEFIVFMREDRELCTYFKFHQQKILFFLAAMRSYREELERNKIFVEYQELDKDELSFEKAFSLFLKSKNIKKLFLFEIEDKFFERRIKSIGIETEILPSPMFLTSREDFSAYLKKSKRPFMKSFYEGQRKRLRVLVDSKLNPLGGQWSFDEENRLPLPAKIIPPPLPVPKTSKLVLEVKELVEKNFSSHPGSLEHLWLPVTREEAKAWLSQFLRERLKEFGPYEDAIPAHSNFLFHSVLTPFLNTGLITPKEVVEEAIHFARKSELPLASLEGFIRQVIGWREFVRGIYQNFSERQDRENFWQHKEKLNSLWYDGNTGIPPLDNTIAKIHRFGFAHHIERLMIVGSLMLLLEVDPKEAHRWFMEMFVDSSDWVMGPNVYGMALFSDGGIFATKPYICGSNYYRKMGGYKMAEWCDGVDGLYWSFIEKHKSFFQKNPRLSMMARSVEKLDPQRKQAIYHAADRLRERLLQP